MRQANWEVCQLTSSMREQGKQAADVALMTCVLFLHFEVDFHSVKHRLKTDKVQTPRGHYGSALPHINGGVKIVSKLQSNNSLRSNLTVSSIPYVKLPAFSQIVSIRHPQELSTRDSGDDADISPTFNSFESARSALGYVILNARRMAVSLSHTPPESIASAGHIISLDLLQKFTPIRLNQRSAAFEHLLRHKYDLTTREQGVVRI
jgi:hypothetical protein